MATRYYSLLNSLIGFLKFKLKTWVFSISMTPIITNIVMNLHSSIEEIFKMKTMVLAMNSIRLFHPQGNQ